MKYGVYEIMEINGYYQKIPEGQIDLNTRDYKKSSNNAFLRLWKNINRENTPVRVFTISWREALDVYNEVKKKYPSREFQIYDE